MQQFLKDYEATPLDKKPILVIGMQVVILYIARIAKAASHKLLGKSSLNGSFVLSCRVLTHWKKFTPRRVANLVTASSNDKS